MTGSAATTYIAQPDPAPISMDTGIFYLLPEIQILVECESISNAARRAATCTVLMGAGSGWAMYIVAVPCPSHAPPQRYIRGTQYKQLRRGQKNPVGKRKPPPIITSH